MKFLRLLRQQLLRPASSVLLVKIVTMGFTTIVGILLARVLQPSEFGAYSYLCAIAALLNVPGSIGAPVLMVRELPVFLMKQQHNLVNGILSWGYSSTLIASLLLGCVGVAIIMLTANADIQHSFTIPVAVAFLGFTVLTTLVQMQAAALRGLGQVLVSQLPALAEQLLFVLAIGLLLLLSWERMGGSTDALYRRVGAEIVTFAAAFYALAGRSSSLLTETEATVRSREWLHASYPFVLATGAQVINAKIDIAMVGSMIGSEAAGLYQVATKAPELLGLFYLTFSTIASPRISALHAAGAHTELQQLISKGALYIAVGSTAVSLILLGGGPWLISVVFGPEYRQAYPMLAILCVSRLLFNMFGLCDATLQMLGDQQYVARTLLAMAACNAILNYVLIHLVGLNGAAWATGISLIAWNVVLSRRLLKYYSLRSGVEGYVRKRLRLSGT